MTENFKKLLELASNDEALKAKINNASKDVLIALAKENGIALTDVDFEQSGEMSEDELNAVTGGFGIIIDWSGEPIEVAIGDPDRDPKPLHCLFGGIGKIEM